MEHQKTSAAVEAVFAVPELLEHILTYLLSDLLLLTDGEDPKSVRVHSNARVLRHLLRMTEVSRSWRHCVYGSNRLLRALFLLPDRGTRRSWIHSANHIRSRLRGSYYTAPSMRAPQLNPIIQSAFPCYEFRFWRLDPEKTGNKYCASLIIARRDIPDVKSRIVTGLGKSVSDMLLAQPPCTALQAKIHDERDETRDYTGRTIVLKDPLIQCDYGVTLGMVHDFVAKMFDEHWDVAAIKLTTI